MPTRASPPPCCWQTELLGACLLPQTEDSCTETLLVALKWLTIVTINHGGRAAPRDKMVPLVPCCILGFYSVPGTWSVLSDLGWNRADKGAASGLPGWARDH